MSNYLLRPLSLLSQPWAKNKGKEGTAMFSALLAVVMFSLTAPMSEVALKAFSAEFITFFRAGVAGLCSLLLAGYLEWKLPSKKDCIGILIGGLAVILVFPYSLAMALSQWQASDLGVVLAGIPLLTACMAVLIFREKQNIVFWLCILVGTLLLMAFVYGQSSGVIHWSLFVMLLAAGIGYSFGGQVAKSVGGFKTICWMAIFYLPISALGLGYETPHMVANFKSAQMDSILGLLYLAFISQWIGFHYWYGAMAKVGIARAGQVQLLQPFFTLLFSVPLIDAVLNAQQFVFAGLITATVIVSIKYKEKYRGKVA
jgi:drug/metabolite transporter (DMT)-like permease